MKKIENASGTMMNGDVPVLRFVLDGGFLKDFEIINRSIQDSYWFKFSDDSEDLSYEKLITELNRAGH